MTTALGPVAVPAIPSWTCGVVDLAEPVAVEDRARAVLGLGEGWAGRWTTTWRVAGADVVCPVRDLGSFPVAGCEPVRRFSWRTDQRHRPGLEFLVSTGRHHGFESIAEQRLLLALDFAGEVTDVLAQPHRMRFRTETGWFEHVPDFLAVTRGGTWLFDVRPAGRVEQDDLVKFAASAEAALSAGWRYLVVGGWRRQVVATLDTVASQRRPVADPLGIQGALLAGVAAGPRRFGDLVGGVALPALGRAQALHLVWRRRLGVDLAAPFTDGALVWPAGAPA
jgi:hypothetical protein